jgi:signal transduction histidine kinase
LQIVCEKLSGLRHRLNATNVTEDRFSNLVVLACHDLRTPLATVHGFAHTLARLELDETAVRYVGMISAATAQLAELIDQLALAARIEAGRYDPVRREIDTLELARAAAARLGEERVEVDGEGTTLEADADATERAVAALARCALRHGGLERVRLRVSGEELELSPVTAASAPVLLGEDLRDLGAAVAVRALRAQGGSVELDGETLRIALPR